MYSSTIVSQPEARDQQSTPSCFSPAKIAIVILSVLLSGLAAACVLVPANSAKKTAGLAEAAPQNVGKPAPRVPSHNIGYIVDSDQAASCSDILALPDSIDGIVAATDTEMSRLGAVRQFCFGTRTRKTVFFAVAFVLFLLIFFVTVYFAILYRPSGGAEGASDHESGGSTDGTPQQQAQSEVSHMLALDPGKVYGFVSSALFGTATLAAGATLLACSESETKIGPIATWRKNLKKPRLAATALCSVVVFAVVFASLGLYFGDNRAFWWAFYAMTMSSVNYTTLLLFFLGFEVTAVLLWVFMKYGRKGSPRPTTTRFYNRNSLKITAALIGSAIIFTAVASICIYVVCQLSSAYPGAVNDTGLQEKPLDPASFIYLTIVSLLALIVYGFIYDWKTATDVLRAIDAKVPGLSSAGSRLCAPLAEAYSTFKYLLGIEEPSAFAGPAFDDIILAYLCYDMWTITDYILEHRQEDVPFAVDMDRKIEAALSSWPMDLDTRIAELDKLFKICNAKFKGFNTELAFSQLSPILQDLKKKYAVDNSCILSALAATITDALRVADLTPDQRSDVHFCILDLCYHGLLNRSGSEPKYMSIDKRLELNSKLSKPGLWAKIEKIRNALPYLRSNGDLILDPKVVDMMTLKAPSHEPRYNKAPQLNNYLELVLQVLNYIPEVKEYLENDGTPGPRAILHESI